MLETPPLWLELYAIEVPLGCQIGKPSYSGLGVSFWGTMPRESITQTSLELVSKTIRCPSFESCRFTAGSGVRISPSGFPARLNQSKRLRPCAPASLDGAW